MGTQLELLEAEALQPTTGKRAAFARLLLASQRIAYPLARYYNDR